MRSAELRQRFLQFFEAQGHTLVPSDGLIPSGDPTVLFTSAGMNQFKDYFLGKRTDLKRAVSCQTCLRTGDLERVGKTASHHSFFEMLGNFSFGDYFKADAIQWAWEFLTGTLDYAGTPSPDRKKLCLGLPRERLWVSIYEEDDEAFKLWRALGLPEDRIKRFGQADNFWPANAPTEGPNGPCGPCSEIYYDRDGKVQGPKSVEMWNLVFTQFDRQPDGSLKALPKPNIDTGMGLERLARVIQKVETDYETDLFAPIMTAIEHWTRPGTRLRGDEQLAGKRAIADHVRAVTFLLSEGVAPSNVKQGYVLRTLVRRTCLRVEHALGVGVQSEDMIRCASDLVTAVESAMEDSPYAKDIAKRKAVVREALSREIKQFQQTLEAGSDRLTAVIAKTRQAKQSVIEGQEVFELYDTYGLPPELTADLANARGLSIDREGFERALSIQQERSRMGSQFTGGVFVSDTLHIREMIKDLPSKEAQFVGYESLQSDAVIQGLWDGTGWVTKAAAGQTVSIVLDRSPFYGEAGGQIGDAGAIEGPRGAADVRQTTWVDDVLLHHATVRTGSLNVQDPVRALVEGERRLKVARSHTAAHLLHWALRKVLGPDAVQAGSFVEEERVRFDFSSLNALQEEQRHDVQVLVNRRVALADEVRASQMQLEEAKRAGALALFGEKYGSAVRVVTIGDYSKELCGGTHLVHTGCVGTFMITGESSIAAGTRRIEALVGEAAAQRQHQQQRLLHDVAKRLGRATDEVVQGLEELLEQLKRAERERKSLQRELATVQAGRLVAEAKQIHGVTLVSSTIKQADRALLAALADAVKGSLSGDGVVLLASSDGPTHVSMVMATTRNLAKRIHAGDLLKAVAPLTNGSGGGRAEFAQAGGKDPSGIPAALRRAEELVREALNQ